MNAKSARSPSRFSLAWLNAAALLLCHFVLRLVLFAAFRPPSTSALDVLKTFGVGLHLDIFVALALTLPLVCWLALLPDRWFRAAWHRFLFQAVFFLFWFGTIFLLFAEYYFFEEFRSRFNTVAVDYLIYPTEVFGNIRASYPVPAIVVVCGLLATGLLLLVRKVTSPVWRSPATGVSRLLPAGGVTAAVVALWFTVSSGETRSTNERLLNELSSNGPFAFVNAAWSRNLDYSAFYRVLPRDEAIRRAQRLVVGPAAASAGDANPLQRRVAGSFDRPKYNVVILLEESLGSEFWGCLGRPETLTPEMDRLAAEEGILFENLYASGNRTVRGLEGVLSSFPPLPGDSIVKRDKSDNVETIARILKRDGYNTLFLYGGRGMFDGMHAFAVDNGYDRFIEQKHFKHPTFTTIWGVCDEDLYARTIGECRALAAAGRPFLATVLSVSNHKPYTYPKGRIAEDPGRHRRENAVKYADHALGRFFREVKQESFYAKTIFVVVADHGARVYGSQSIPMHSYEIPLLIVGPAVVAQPGRRTQLGCSLDVAPTILGLLGRPYDSLFFGRDLLNGSPGDGRVLINHNRDIGMFRDDRLVVLGINKTVEYYHGNPKTGLDRVRQPDAGDLELEKDATALFQAADDLYTHKRYCVRHTDPSSAWEFNRQLDTHCPRP